MSNAPRPGLAQQAGVRTFFRIAGLVLLPISLGVFAWGVVNVFGNDSWAGPEGLHVAAFIGGLPLIGASLMLLQAGFMGAAARYGAGETMPVVKDSAAYLTDGEGVLGVGRTVDDRAGHRTGENPGAAPAAGPYCRSCGVRNDQEARFCDGCGSSIA
ncbi:zinc-ribbon domain-containing protein [Nocardioides sp. GCM10027113]|uniref:zinc-ribbon domain-containing protein n=1 Tax=unclassified Nocardioides TaxID=2615069 RepID=UPI0036146F29